MSQALQQLMICVHNLQYQAKILSNSCERFRGSWKQSTASISCLPLGKNRPEIIHREKDLGARIWILSSKMQGRILQTKDLKTLYSPWSFAGVQRSNVNKYKELRNDLLFRWKDFTLLDTISQIKINRGREICSLDCEIAASQDNVYALPYKTSCCCLLKVAWSENFIVPNE